MIFYNLFLKNLKHKNEKSELENALALYINISLIFDFFKEYFKVKIS